MPFTFASPSSSSSLPLSGENEMLDPFFVDGTDADTVGSVSKRKRDEEGDEEQKGCAISGFINKESMCPPILHEEKRKRRKRAKTEEEKEQRALERKLKNRQSAMRSRRRVLNELKKDKEEIQGLRDENEEQKIVILKLQKQLAEAKRQLSLCSPPTANAVQPAQQDELFLSAPGPGRGEKGPTEVPEDLSLCQIECQMSPSITPFSVFDDPSALDFLDVMASTEEKLGKLEYLNPTEFSLDRDMSFDVALLLTKPGPPGLEEKDCEHFPVQGGVSSDSSSCGSESLYHETAYFGCTSNLNKLSSIACTYNFSWLSEILRLRPSPRTQDNEDAHLATLSVQKKQSNLTSGKKAARSVSHMFRLLLQNSVL